MVPKGTNDDFYVAFSLHLEGIQDCFTEIGRFWKWLSNKPKVDLVRVLSFEKKTILKLTCVAGRLITSCSYINPLLRNLHGGHTRENDQFDLPINPLNQPQLLRPKGRFNPGMFFCSLTYQI